jgi:hypothetical protein
MYQLNRQQPKDQGNMVLDGTKTKITDNPEAGKELTMKRFNAIPGDASGAFSAA